MALLFVGTAMVAAVTVGAMLISRWRAGALDDRVEWIFWAGAILGAAGIALLGAAAGPHLAESVAVPRLTRAGLVLFLLAPALCVVAVFANYWI